MDVSKQRAYAALAPSGQMVVKQRAYAALVPTEQHVSSQRAYAALVAVAGGRRRQAMFVN